MVKKDIYKNQDSEMIDYMIKIHLEGQTYGRLFVMYDFEKEIGKSKKNMHICHCKCICGNEVDVFACHLRSGHTQSCGCYKNEQIRKTKNKKHELSHNHLYKKFYSIIGRCHNPKDKAYHNYGARGIKILPHFNSVVDFCNYVSELEKQAKIKYGNDAKLSLDRIDNNGDYMEGNLRVVPDIIQNRNRRTNVVINNMCVSEICEKYNIKRSTIYARKRRHNCSTEEAVLYYLDKMANHINQKEY